MTRRNKLLTASALQLIACTRRPPTSHEPLNSAQMAPPDASAEPAIAQLPSPVRDEDLVSDAHFARRTLFTWTTRAQIDELRRDRVLLTRAESAIHGASFFDQTMQARAASGDTLAALLRIPSFRRARFAWANAWATVRGWEGEHYGHSLVRVTLKPDAWVARFSTRTNAWTVHDLQDQPVAPSALELHPTRLAAVYFVHDVLRSPQDPMGTNYAQGGAPYREYVLCNESMIESWEIGTAAVQSEIDASITLARALANALRQRADRTARWPRESTARWRDPCGADPLLDGYLGAIAFLNERYAPSAINLDAVATELEGLARDLPALTHEPSATALPPPPSAHPQPRPARPPRRSGGLIGTY